jgi:hypothetical protein
VALGRETAHVQDAHGRAPVRAGKAVDPAANDVRVHARAADVLADLVEDEHVDLGKGQGRHPGAGLAQQLGLAGLDVLAVHHLDPGQAVAAVFHEPDAEDPRQLRQDDGRGLAQHGLVAMARRGAVALERALGLAEADRRHLQQPAAEGRAREVGVRLHAVDEDDRIGRERVAGGPDAEAERRLAEVHRLDRRHDRRARGVLRDAQGFEHLDLSRGGPAAVAAHRGKEERPRPPGFQGLDRRAHDGHDAVDPPASHGHRDAKARPLALGQRGVELRPGLRPGVRQGMIAEPRLDEHLLGKSHPAMMMRGPKTVNDRAGEPFAASTEPFAEKPSRRRP